MMHLARSTHPRVRRPGSVLLTLALGAGLAACGSSADDGDDGDGGGDLDAGNRVPDTTITSGPAPLTNQPTARFELAADVADATFLCTVAGREPVACRSPYEVTVADGDHALEVIAIGPDGARDRSPARRAWTVDTVAPQAGFSARPPALDNTPNPRFEFGVAAGDVATFACQLDGGVFAPCTSPHDVGALADGPHRFAVQATDLAGNVETPPIAHAWTIDSAPPDTTITGGPSGPVNVRAAAFTFTSPAADAAFRCRVDQGPWQVCASPFELAALSEGPHRLDVQASTPSGATDPTPATRAWTVDVTAPTATIASGPTGATSDNTPTFTFGTLGDATAVDCRIVTATTPPAFAPCSSPFTPDPVADGAATFEVRATDAAGNAVTVDRAFVVDTLAPTIEITAGPTGATTTGQPQFAFVAAADATARHCRFDAGAWLTCASPYAPSTVLGDGDHTFAVRATDAAGNQGVATRAFSVDKVAPTVTILTGPPTTTYSSDTTPTFTFTASDGAVACRLNGGAFAPCSSPFTPEPLADGGYTLTVRAVDVAGNTGSASRVFGIDTRPTSVTITSGPMGPTTDRTPSFTWTTIGAIVQLRCRYDAEAFQSCTTLANVSLAEGPHTFEIRVTDDTNHVVAATQSFTVDTVAPGVDFTGGPSGTITSADVTFTFTTSGAPSVTQCRLYRQGSPSGSYTPCASPVDLTLAPPSTPYPYIFEVRVRDEAGNQWSAYRAFTYAP